MKKINIIIIFLMLLVYAYIVNIINIPDKYVITNYEDYNFYTMPGIVLEKVVETTGDNEVNSVNKQSIKYKYSLFGIKDIKETIVVKFEDIKLIPVGKLIGLKLYTNGVLVVGTSNIEDINNNIKIQENILEGDMIVKIGDFKISTIEEIKDVIKTNNGDDLKCTVIRDGEEIISTIKPIQTSEKEYKLGLWVKDAATGVGTLSFVNKEDKTFFALGHSITDKDTGKIIDIDSGEIIPSEFVSLTKGEIGKAGEIRGSIINKSKIGEITKNTEYGLIGRITSLSNGNFDFNNELSILPRNKIKLGKAVLMCELDEGIKEYDIEIKKLNMDNNFDNRSMVIEVIDKELIDKTGGIIRGMSGSPIIQDGKIAGIVTNVFISNPKIGYGVFMDLVLNEM